MKKIINLANFNCTFKKDEEIQPMLFFFDGFIHKALTNESFVRMTKDNEYYLTDVQIVDLSKTNKNLPELALIGRHVRRVRLEIKNDYSVESGFIPIGETKYSAPYSTFLLLLKNHRIIHIKDQPGSPNIRSLGATIKEFIKQYRAKIIKDILKDNNLDHDNYRIKNYIEQNILNKKEQIKYLEKVVFPKAEINIVPIPSVDVIDRVISNIKKIKSINFRVYPLNSELDFSGFFKALRTATTEIESPSGQVLFNGPKDIKTVGDYIKESKGLADFTMYAKTDKEEITLKPDEFVENIYVSIPEELTTMQQAKEVYKRIENKDEIKLVSDDNEKNYLNYLNKKN